MASHRSADFLAVGINIPLTGRESNCLTGLGLRLETVMQNFAVVVMPIVVILSGERKHDLSVTEENPELEENPEEEENMELELL